MRRGAEGPVRRAAARAPHEAACDGYNGVGAGPGWVFASPSGGRFPLVRARVVADA